MVLIDRLINRLFISYFIEPRIKQNMELCSIISGIELVEFEDGLSSIERLLLKLVCKFNIKSSSIHIRMRKNGFVCIDLSEDIYPTFLITGGKLSLFSGTLHIIDIYGYICRGLYGNK